MSLTGCRSRDKTCLLLIQPSLQRKCGEGGTNRWVRILTDGGIRLHANPNHHVGLSMVGLSNPSCSSSRLRDVAAVCNRQRRRGAQACVNVSSASPFCYWKNLFLPSQLSWTRKLAGNQYMQAEQRRFIVQTRHFYASQNFSSVVANVEEKADQKNEDGKNAGGKNVDGEDKEEEKVKEEFEESEERNSEEQKGLNDNKRKGGGNRNAVKLLMFAALQIVPLSIGIIWLILYSNKRVEEEVRYQQILELSWKEEETGDVNEQKQKQLQLLMDEIRNIDAHPLTRRLLVVPSSHSSFEVRRQRNQHSKEGAGNSPPQSGSDASTDKLAFSGFKRQIDGVVRGFNEALKPKPQSAIEQRILLQLPQWYPLSPSSPSLDQLCQSDSSYFLINSSRRPIIELKGRIESIEGHNNDGLTIQFLPTTLICSINSKGPNRNGLVIIDLKENYNNR